MADFADPVVDTLTCRGPPESTISKVSDTVAPGVLAVIVTRDRPAHLDDCLMAVRRQTIGPARVIVVDNASGSGTQAVLRRHPWATTLSMVRNAGGAGGFWAGVAFALDRGAEWVWLMDDDGRPLRDDCLACLLDAGRTADAGLVGPLVIDVDHPAQLAFPIRLDGRTVFDVRTVLRHGRVPGFAHLFNGVLVRASLFRTIGLPDPRFMIRGDEVEFLFRARASGAVILLEPRAGFLHPGSRPEIHPILFGRYHACVPGTAEKRYLQFRNRAWIFRRYGKWLWLAADVIRYGCHFLVHTRDVAGFQAWAAATLDGLRGRFMRP